MKPGRFIRPRIPRIGGSRTGQPEFASRDDARFDVPEILARNNYEYVQLDRLLEAHVPSDAARCVDIGCAYGRFVPLLREYSDVVVGVEPRDEARQRAVDLYPESDFTDAVAGKLPFADGSVDIAVVWKVLQHLDAARARNGLVEIERILTPSSVLVLCEETAPSAGDDRGTFSRPASFYEDALDGLELVAVEPRALGEDPAETPTASVMVYQFRGGSE